MVCLSLLALLMNLSRSLFIRLWEARGGRDQGEERMKVGGVRREDGFGWRSAEPKSSLPKSGE